jgi:hypothetical protein
MLIVKIQILQASRFLRCTKPVLVNIRSAALSACVRRSRFNGDEGQKPRVWPKRLRFVMQLTTYRTVDLFGLRWILAAALSTKPA